MNRDTQELVDEVLRTSAIDVVRLGENIETELASNVASGASASQVLELAAAMVIDWGSGLEIAGLDWLRTTTREHVAKNIATTAKDPLSVAAQAYRESDPELFSITTDEELVALLKEALPIIKAVAVARRQPRLTEPPTRGPINIEDTF